MEGDSCQLPHVDECPNFYPRPPGGGRRWGLFCYFKLRVFLSTPSGWRATLKADVLVEGIKISIHALRVEGDQNNIIHLPPPSGYFYPRPPGGGRRLVSAPTVSAACDFYPRPPGGGRPGSGRHYQRFYEISIHALRVEGDEQKLNLRCPIAVISIHALRVEGDSWLQGVFKTDWTISIHALRVEGDCGAGLSCAP